MNITIEQVEDAIDSYLDHVANFNGEIPSSFQDLLTFVADELNVNQDELEAEYGDILSAAINHDEDGYIEAGDAHRKSKAEYKSELQDSFMQFYKNSMMNEDIDEDLYKKLMEDPLLRKVRETPSYIAKDVPGKFHEIWRYAITKYGKHCADEDSLGDTCEQIAMADERTL